MKARLSFPMGRLWKSAQMPVQTSLTIGFARWISEGNNATIVGHGHALCP